MDVVMEAPLGYSLVGEASLTLTAEELHWAHAIKDAVESNENLKNRSHYEYASYAIYCRDNLEDSLNRVENMQHFREEYGIQEPETVAEAMEALTRFVELLPWFILDVDYNPSGGHFVVIIDLARRTPKDILGSDEHWRTYCGGIYFLFQMLQASLSSIRQGPVLIMECEGDGWENFKPELTQRLWHHMVCHYPLNLREASFIHASSMVNLLYSVIKGLPMNNFLNSFRMSDQFASFHGRLDEVFKAPSPEAAHERVISRFQSFLELRYNNEQTYRLPGLEMDGGGGSEGETAAGNDNDDNRED